MPTIISVLRTRLGGDTMLGKGAAMALARGINILSGFLLAVVLARVLGANGYGTYLFALAIAQMLAMPSMMGLPALLMRQIAIYASEERYELINGIVRWGLKLVLMATFVVSLGFGAFVLSRSITNGRPTSLELYVWIVPFVLATGLMSWASAILHGFQRPFWASLPDGTIRPLLLLGAVAALAGLGQLNPVSAMGLHVAATTMAFVWAAIMVWRYCDLGGEVHLGTRAASDHRAWFSSLWPLFLTVAAATINSKLDLVMLGALRPSGDVALYGLAVQLAALVVVPQTILNTIIAPRIAAAGARNDKDELQKTISSACLLSFIGALAAIVLLVLFGRQMVSLFFGAEFAATYDVLIVLSVGQLIISSMAPAIISLNMLHDEKRVAGMVVASGGVNIVLNILLIPTFGIMGAAVATIITNAGLQMICAIVLYRRHRLIAWAFLSRILPRTNEQERVV